MKKLKSIGSAKITSQGQITIPRHVLKRLEASRGNYLTFALQEETGYVVVVHRFTPEMDL